MQTDLDTVIQKKVRALPLNLQEEVLEYVEKISSPGMAARPDEVEQEVTNRLLTRGLIDEVPEPMSDEEGSNFELFSVRGENLSDIIIQERR